MAARNKADQRFGTALDCIATRFAQSFAAGKIGIDFVVGQAFESDNGFDQPGPGNSIEPDYADRRNALVPPPGNQRQKLALDSFGFSWGQDPAPERDRGITSQHNLAGKAFNRLRLSEREPQGIGAWKFGLQWAFVDVWTGDPVRSGPDPGEQIAAARGRTG